MKKSKSGLPELNLKQGDFGHQVPEGTNVELCVVYKRQGVEKEFLGPVMMFGISGDKFKVVNRNLPDRAYTFYLKEIKRVIVLPMEM